MYRSNMPNALNRCNSLKCCQGIVPFLTARYYNALLASKYHAICINIVIDWPFLFWCRTKKWFFNSYLKQVHFITLIKNLPKIKLMEWSEHLLWKKRKILWRFTSKHMLKHPVLTPAITMCCIKSTVHPLNKHFK